MFSVSCHSRGLNSEYPRDEQVACVVCHSVLVNAGRKEDSDTSAVLILFTSTTVSFRFLHNISTDFLLKCIVFFPAYFESELCCFVVVVVVVFFAFFVVLLKCIVRPLITFRDFPA